MVNRIVYHKSAIHLRETERRLHSLAAWKECPFKLVYIFLCKKTPVTKMTTVIPGVGVFSHPEVSAQLLNPEPTR